jgi:hypothetical protein
VRPQRGEHVAQRGPFLEQCEGKRHALTSGTAQNGKPAENVSISLSLNREKGHLVIYTDERNRYLKHRKIEQVKMADPLDQTVLVPHGLRALNVLKYATPDIYQATTGRENAFVLNWGTLALLDTAKGHNNAMDSVEC